MKKSTPDFRLIPSMKWFGPKDSLSLSTMKSFGCETVATALYDIPAGTVWYPDEIDKHKLKVNEAGLDWLIVENLPVHEDIKTLTGDYLLYIENYKETLHNLAQSGIRTVCYNFTPIFDRSWDEYMVSWSKWGISSNFLDMLEFCQSDTSYSLADPAISTDLIKMLNPKFIENQPATQNGTSSCQRNIENENWASFTEKLGVYKFINDAILRIHLYDFWKQIIPVAERLQIKMAILPDLPIIEITGLPAIARSYEDLASVLSTFPSPNNGLCFSTAAFGIGMKIKVADLFSQIADEIHYIQLTDMDEAEGRGQRGVGETDLYNIVKELINIMWERRVSLPMRPALRVPKPNMRNQLDFLDHSINEQLRFLAELRGLETGLRKMMLEN